MNLYTTYLNLCAATSSPWQRAITCSRAMCSVNASLLTESLRVKNLQVCSRDTNVVSSKFCKIAMSVASGSWSKDCVELSVKDCILVLLSAISNLKKMHCKCMFVYIYIYNSGERSLEFGSWSHGVSWPGARALGCPTFNWDSVTPVEQGRIAARKRPEKYQWCMSGNPWKERLWWVLFCNIITNCCVWAARQPTLTSTWFNYKLQTGGGLAVKASVQKRSYKRISRWQ